jgi:sigma-B regulation protein RsbU (phosphoserine phosphatase)
MGPPVKGNVADLEEYVATLERKIDHLRQIQDCTITLISSLDLDETLQIILTTALDVGGAGNGSILLYDTDRTHLTIASAIGLREETIQTTRIADGEGITGLVAQTGEPVLVEDIDNDSRFKEQRSRSDRSRSFACLPLKYHDRTLGVMNLSHPTGNLPFEQQSLPLLTALASQAAVALAHSELHNSLLEKERLEQQLETAQAIQESFIAPALQLSEEGFEFAGRNAAAKSVGGDLYDVIPQNNGQIAFFLGDVSGKGVPAALFMARLFSDAHHFVGLNPEPDAVLGALNQFLCRRRHRGMFVTMACGLLDLAKGVARVSLAGHPPPMLRRADGSVQTLSPAESPPLGMLPDTSFTSVEVKLHPGDLMLFYSDGVSEAANESREEFGIERLNRGLQKSGGKCAESIDFILDRLNEFTGGSPARDDITFLAVGRVVEN